MRYQKQILHYKMVEEISVIQHRLYGNTSIYNVEINTNVASKYHLCVFNTSCD